MPRTDYEERREARIDRLRERADRNRAEAVQVGSAARDRAGAIPFGQPILIGHHSERRDRNYRARIQRGYEKAAELDSKAQHYEDRADSAERNRAISSDDPEAVRKLQEKIGKLEEKRAAMKSINSTIRKWKKQGEDRQIAELLNLPFIEQESTARALLVPDFAGRIGVPSYELTNLGATIRTAKQRIETLRREYKAQAEPVEDRGGPGFTISENTAENRLQLIFPGKPPEATRSILKREGFRWSPYNGAWQRQLNNAARYAADRVCAVLKGGQS